MNSSPLRTAIIGLGLAGKEHAARIVAEPTDFMLVAGCDMSPETRAAFGAAYPGIPIYGDFAEMLARERPDVVVIATTAPPRSALTLQAVAAGVRGLYVEKPISVSLGEARRMVAACVAKDVPLIVNHQRRTLPVFRAMRRLIAGGAIGGIRSIRASCAGDLLSDGTHLVDTVRFLVGDAPVSWVAGMVTLQADGTRLSADPRFTGVRYGHAVEHGCIGIMAFGNGIRAELHTGALQFPGTRYQFYEVIGSDGRLMRDGDASPLLIQDQTAGGWREATIEPVDGLPPPRGLAHPENYRDLARLVRGERFQHPLAAASALADHEILMGILESARVHECIALPVTQEEYPIDLLRAEVAGQMRARST